MIYYNLSSSVEAFSTNIGDDISSLAIVTPMHQAHSTRVVEIRSGKEDTYGVDALITNVKGLGIGVRTADCVPVLLFDSGKRAAAAIHSGWKGTADCIIFPAIEKMIDVYGTCPHDIQAVIGPCIHVEAFEVGDEVYETFCAKGYASHCRRMANPYDCASEVKWHIDLPAICRQQLSACGVTDIFTSPLCTYSNHDTLYSYRRSRSSDRSHRIITAVRIL